MPNNTIEHIGVLPAGTVVRVNGVPLVLCDNTRAKEHPAILKTALQGNESPSAMFVGRFKSGHEDHHSPKED